MAIMSKRRKSSRRWVRAHQQDEFVRKAQSEGWRSRAVFKLSELQERYALIRPGMTIVDLGAAPGAWSQFAASCLKGKGRIIAVDLLPMDAQEGVTFIQGDFRENSVLEEINAALGDDRVDLVMSDMAPNISGVKAVDQPRAMLLAELAFEFATEHLNPGGTLLSKVFHGEGFDALVRVARERFGAVRVRKPKASRPQSREVYLLARNYRM